MVVAVCVPDVPVTVRGYWPTGVVLPAFTVSVLPPIEELMGLGLNEAVTPLGRPETDRLTLPVNTYSDSTYTELELEVP